MNKEERINSKKNELLQIFSGLSDDELKVASGLIEQAAFIDTTLEDLAEKISVNGTSEEYTNGTHQSGRKISSDAKLYSALISKYVLITTKLLKMIPDKKELSTRRIIPEKEMISKIEYATQYNQNLELQKAKDEAFFEAVKEGKIKQSDYNSFIEGEIEI